MIYQCGYGKMHCFLATYCAFSSSESCVIPSTVPVSSRVLLAWRCTAGVAYCSRLLESAMVLATDQGRMLVSLWFSNVFLTFRCSSSVCVH